MQVQSVCISFGYKNRLKTEWLKGNLPELQHDFYDGKPLDSKTVTLEHLQPKSKGGKTTITNLVLTSYYNNHKRGNRDIRDYINIEAAKKYIEEAKQMNAKGINGIDYANGITNKLRSLGVVI